MSISSSGTTCCNGPTVNPYPDLENDPAGELSVFPNAQAVYQGWVDTHQILQRASASALPQWTGDYVFRVYNPTGFRRAPGVAVHLERWGPEGARRHERPRLRQHHGLVGGGDAHLGQERERDHHAAEPVQGRGGHRLPVDLP